jgi:hypothetical protein
LLAPKDIMGKKNIMGTKKHNGDKKLKNITSLYENETRTGNRYQARSNFDVTSFRHQLISSSFSSSRSNRDVTSFQSDMGTNQRTDQRTNGRTNIVSYRGATSYLKRCEPKSSTHSFREIQLLCTVSVTSGFRSTTECFIQSPTSNFFITLHIGRIYDCLKQF